MINRSRTIFSERTKPKCDKDQAGAPRRFHLIHVPLYDFN